MAEEKSRRLRIAYAAGIALPALAVAAGLALDARLGDQSLMILFIAPVALSAYLGGLGPGVLATFVAALSMNYWLIPPRLLLHFSWTSIELLSLLVAVGLIGSVSIAALQRQQARLRHALEAAEARARKQHASDERFTTVFHSAPVAIMIVRLSDGHIVDVNSAFTELWGLTRSEALGRTSTELGLWVESAQLIRKLKENRHSDVQELQICLKSGEIRDALVSVKLIQVEATAHLLITAADVTERNRAREMEHIAHHDTLTNLPNRLLLQEKLRLALERSAMQGSSSAVLFVDLDRFKQVNDSLGHNAGDELLRLVSARLQGRIRGSDIVARVGGDEFIVLLEGLPSAEDALTIGADLIQHISKPFMLSRGHEVHIGASVGISYFTGATDVELLIRQADAALYAAKSSGRSAVRVFESQMALT